MPYYPSHYNRNTSYHRPANRSYSYSRPYYPRSNYSSRLSGGGAYRYRRAIRGRGAYSYDNPGPYGRAGESVGSFIGKTYGGAVGKYALGKAGRYVGHKVGKLFGSGAYGVTDASATSIGDILTSSTTGGLKINHYPLNPSSTQTFPWLSNIAGPNYQQYRFDGLVFEFKSFSANALNSSNTALGSVFACINYDSTDQDFSSRNEIENSDWSRSCKPSEDVMIPVECAPRQTSMRGLLYIINQNNIPANTDLKTYLLGRLSIGTTGFQAANVNIGSLYVTYKIRLYKPLMTKPAAFSDIVQYTRTGVTSAGPLGTSTIANNLNCDSLGVTFDSNTTFTISKNRLIKGQIYIMRAEWQGILTANVAAPPMGSLVSNGISGVSQYVSTSAAYLNHPGVSGITDTVCGTIFSFIVTDDTTDVSITFPSGGTLPDSSQLIFNLWQICGVAPAVMGFYDGKS